MNQNCKMVARRMNGEVFSCPKYLLGMEIWNIREITRVKNHERTIILIYLSVIAFIKYECKRNLVKWIWKLFICVFHSLTSKEKWNKLYCHTSDIEWPKKMLLIICNLLSIFHEVKGHLLFSKLLFHVSQVTLNSIVIFEVWLKII